jgi:thiol:disulfide interchange protein
VAEDIGHMFFLVSTSMSGIFTLKIMKKKVKAIPVTGREGP